MQLQTVLDREATSQEMYAFPKRNQPPEQQQATQAQQQAQRQEYQRALSACMDARGYSVKEENTICETY